MFGMKSRRSDTVRQLRLRKIEARRLKYWKLKIKAAGLVLCLLSGGLAHADESTGLPLDDPKDLHAYSTTTRITRINYAQPFIPMPQWAQARFDKMPPLPDQLKPMGKKPAPAVTAAPTPAPNAAPVTPMVVTAGKPKTADVNPTLIAVSPFLQWIKDHPKDAAAEAQKQASSYRAPAGSSGNGGSSDDPYWMPPLDSSDNSSGPSTENSSASSTVTHSAAIYSSPQRN